MTQPHIVFSPLDSPGQLATQLDLTKTLCTFTSYPCPTRRWGISSLQSPAHNLLMFDLVALDRYRALFYFASSFTCSLNASVLKTAQNFTAQDLQPVVLPLVDCYSLSIGWLSFRAICTHLNVHAGWVTPQQKRRRWMFINQLDPSNLYRDKITSCIKLY